MIVITSESNENNLYENHINNSDAMSFITYNYNFTIYPTKYDPKFYSSLLNLFSAFIAR